MNKDHQTVEAAIEWLRFTHPICEHFAAGVRDTDLSGKHIAAWMHLLPATILALMPFVDAGAKVRVGACNPDSTNPLVRPFNSVGCIVCRSGLYSLPVLAKERQDALENQY